MAEKNGAELITALRKAFSRLGTPDGVNGTKVPRVNDAVLELAVATALSNMADERKAAARQSVLDGISDMDTKVSNTRMNVFSSKHASLDAQLVKGQSRISRDQLRIVLSKRYGIKIADEIITESSVVGEPSLRLFPSIVALDD